MAKTLAQPLPDTPYAPSEEMPIRVVQRHHQPRTAVASHQHAWGQLVYSRQGVIRVFTPQASFTVPPERAVWIAANEPHRVDVLSATQVFTAHLYRDVPSTALSVPPLLREVLIALSKPSEKRRFDLLSALFCEELKNAPALPLGVRLPQDKRLRQLCEAVLQTPRLDIPLAQWAHDCGASVATVQRLFKRELGCHFNAWRQQALLARATELAAQQLPLAHIALELGYRSQSAFSFMVSQCTGQTASAYFYPKGNEN
ncbi:helix-turn-helix transcriptional regulator [Avibacterium sp. 20-15]|uniref:AraC family transcriptional regulator n=1 Tax=unclassified Avibacterium TaxID=2685287 RepID=UPI0020272F41|nr:MULTISPECIES: helix-turn-helix transcriptional regulator [unclassified Avibacterium]MCW9731981.1 helix-turn-helix transcriptional regulator [Avibacterium sp. 20-15]URL04168.1 helix-turn-helix transcriptional regulator [Avibacterium sp. 20-132]